MKIDFAMKSLFVVDLWFALSIIVCMVLEATILKNVSVYLSVFVLAGCLVLNIIFFIVRYSRKKQIANNKNEKLS